MLRAPVRSPVKRAVAGQGIGGAGGEVAFGEEVGHLGGLVVHDQPELGRVRCAEEDDVQLRVACVDALGQRGDRGLRQGAHQPAAACPDPVLEICAVHGTDTSAGTAEHGQAQQDTEPIATVHAPNAMRWEPIA